MSTLPKNLLTEEQYLELDRAADYKSEYYDGEMFALGRGGSGAQPDRVQHEPRSGRATARHTMPGAAERHARQDRSRRPVCVPRCYRRLRAGGSGRPQGHPYQSNRHRRSTIAFDGGIFHRGFRFVAYTAIPSLRQYVLIAADHVSIEVFTRQPDGLWAPPARATRLEDSIELESVGCRLVLADVYAFPNSLRPKLPPINHVTRAQGRADRRLPLQRPHVDMVV